MSTIETIQLSARRLYTRQPGLIRPQQDGLKVLDDLAWGTASSICSLRERARDLVRGLAMVGFFWLQVQHQEFTNLSVVSDQFSSTPKPVALDGIIILSPRKDPFAQLGSTEAD